MPLNKTMKVRGVKRIKTRKTYKSDKDIGFIVLRHVIPKKPTYTGKNLMIAYESFIPRAKL